MLYATERVALSTTISIAVMIVGMGATYLVLAPSNAVVPGLGMASEGLALKMVVMQLIGANCVAYVIARVWKWPFDWIYQPVSLLGCVALGWLAHGVAVGLSGSRWPLPWRMGLGGALYLPLMAAFVYSMPWLAGLTREELVLDARGILKKLLTSSGFNRNLRRLRNLRSSAFSTISCGGVPR